ncbi:ubiquitin-conjugating enzyme E2 [Thraustotheca clavata]|uniref:Ubiquitin-conjugating enzyme E2 n=1 Tax=Thraustotheca clavata TaxID=74557 RepID=A0A1V9ZYQ8_9STRA|nr:ubiquitin-conjugating enzyme E2 [Thraustotheca clavata]
MAASIGNTAIKRIRADVREMMTDPSDQYYAAPLENNMFDWHFTIRGPRDTEFEGGIFHGRILLPSEYPFKPPNIILLTPNGRFEVKKKICLSISAYHPEHWQPAWGVRLILEALISFMPTKGEGAIGALDFTAEERKKLAQESVHWTCPQCGEIKGLIPEETKHDKPVESKYASQIAQLHIHNMEPTTSPTTSDPESMTKNSDEGSDAIPSSEAAVEEQELPSLPTPAVSTSEALSNSNPKPQQPLARAASAPLPTTPTAAPTPAAPQSDAIDNILQGIASALLVAFLAMVYKKLLQWNGYIVD